MMRKIIFQLHWALGISVGLVLVVVSMTGVTMAFEDEIMRVLSPGIVTIVPLNGPALSPDAILTRVREQQPARQVASLVLPADPGSAARVLFARDPRNADEDRQSYVDPYDGRLLGPATGAHFFRTVRALHRWLLVPGDGNGFGRQITGVAAIGLVYFALSGLWMRWPRRPLDWRQWFVIDLTRSGRSLYRSLHVVIGSWVVVFYLLSGLSGLWWSYDWYKSGVTWLLTGESVAAPDSAAARTDGTKGAEASASKARPEAHVDAFAKALAAVRQASGAYSEVVFIIPKGAKPIRVRVLPSD
ncbi:PepSY domain-containing protein, partial [Beijerinckia sp. L45]|uniref:PepSY-associated TM helix domain-containing protein n=1 Tax=Beijerinckia sp. L45 TaxID=1641855 RepID=UPI0015777896